MDPDRRIVMLGTSPGMPSGIASLVQTYAANGLFQRWHAVYLPTHRNGGLLAKLAIALGAWVDVLGRLAMGRVSLLHIHVASFASFWRKSLFMLAGSLFRVPYVVHLHGGAFVEFYRAQSLPARDFIRNRLRAAARVIVLSREWRDAIGRIEPQARIEVIPNPVDVPAVHAVLEGWPPTVLFLGRLLERKGLQDLLRAWSTVIEAVPDAQLVLAGDGDVDAIRHRARELGIESSLRLAGWVEGDAKERLLRTAWALVLPSHVEALPMAVLESLAAGVPVVATRVGGIPSVVENRGNGLLVPVRDGDALAHALIEVLRDTPARLAMGGAARERAIAEFSSEVIVPRVEAVWRELAPAQEARARARAV